MARLLDAPKKAEDLSDHALGHALDDLYAFGVIRLFGHVTFGIALKQAVLSLVMSGPGQIPIWMDASDGNSSDKTSCHETIRKVRAFQSQIHLESDFQWVADSVLFYTDGLLARNSTFRWIFQIMEGLGIVRLETAPGEGN